MLRKVQKRKYNSDLCSVLEQEEKLVKTVTKLKNSLATLNQNLVTKQFQCERIRKKIKMMTSEKESCDNEGIAIVTKTKEIEEKDPLEIFPEELWFLILEAIPPSLVKDMRNASKTCTLFNWIMNKSRVLWLFEKIFPSIFPYLDNPDIFNCRLVCQGWRAGVDQHFNNPLPLTSKTSPPIHITPLESKGLGKYHSSLVELGQGNLRHFQQEIIDSLIQNPSQNPFLGRAITLLDWGIGISSPNLFEDPDPSLIPNWIVNGRYFGLIGQHISYLNLAFLKTPGYQATGHFLPGLLRHFPNICELRVAGWIENEDDFGAGNGEESVEALMELLPSVPKLEALQLDELICKFGRSQPLVEAMMSRYHSQLKRFHVKSNPWLRSFPNSTPAFPNLEELHLEEFGTEGELLEALERVAMLNLKNLQKLGLSFQSSYYGSLSTLLRSLNKLTEKLPKLATLRLGGSLNFGLDSETTSGNASPLSPSLETVELEYSIWSSYSFLASGFPFIQYLKLFQRSHLRMYGGNGVWLDFKGDIEKSYRRSQIDLNEDDDDDDGDPLDTNYDGSPIIETVNENTRRKPEILEIHSFMSGRSAYECHGIWHLLPNLKAFVYQDTGVYTRERYEWECKQKGVVN